MVRFWDSSALIPLVIQEERSPACRRLYQEGVAIAVWSLTRTEMVSALWRRARAGELDLAAMPRVLARLERLAAKWHEIGDLELVRERAERLLEHHELRAADALQLAAALVLSQEHPRRRDFVTADRVLARAATREGFQVLIQK
jgi:predicted nucleic acid-binding protein